MADTESQLEQEATINSDPLHFYMSIVTVPGDGFPDRYPESKTNQTDHGSGSTYKGMQTAFVGGILVLGVHSSSMLLGIGITIYGPML